MARSTRFSRGAPRHPLTTLKRVRRAVTRLGSIINGAGVRCRHLPAVAEVASHPGRALERRQRSALDAHQLCAQAEKAMTIYTS